MIKYLVLFLLSCVQMSYASAEVKAGDSIIFFNKSLRGQNSDSQLYDNGQIAEITEVLADNSVKTKVHSIEYVAFGKTGTDEWFGNDGAEALMNLNVYSFEKLLSKEIPIHNDIRTGDQIECAEAGFFGSSAIVKLGFTSKLASVSFKSSPRHTMIIQLEQWGCSK